MMLSQRPLGSLATSFVSFHERYSRFFVTQTRSVATQALHYLTGLAQAVRKNIERMTEVVVDSEYQSLHHFISHSPWEHRPVMDQVALDADRLLGGSDAGLIIDETSNPKKGEKSVAVARQWCGNLGKVDNCQVAVFSSLVQGASAPLIDCRLYVPQDWTADQKRCKKAGIPSDFVFKSRYYLGDRTTIPSDDEIVHALTFPQIRIRNDCNRDMIDRHIWSRILQMLLQNMAHL